MWTVLTYYWFHIVKIEDSVVFFFYIIKQFEAQSKTLNPWTNPNSP